MVAKMEEQERGLVTANPVSVTENVTITDDADARVDETTSEDEQVRSAEGLARRFQELDIVPPIPQIVNSSIEYHANIGCYQCFLFLDSDNSVIFPVSQFAIQVKFPRVELTYRNENEQKMQVIWWTQIERNVDVKNCTIEEKDDHWYVRLPIRSSDNQPLGGFSAFTHVSPMELQSENYAIIYCRNCNAHLLHNAKTGEKQIHKVLPLPSANWMDMFDFWGAGIGAFEHLPREDIYAQEHRVLVGESYILLHASDFLAKATTADKVDALSEEKHEWVPITCTGCCERIGLRNVDQSTTIRLYKHLIAACSVSLEKRSTETFLNMDNIFSKYTIDSILSAKLLEKADADGIFRFVLTPSNDEKEMELSIKAQGDAKASLTAIQLQLLSWDTEIKHHDTTTFRRVLKVLYGPVQPTLSNSGPFALHKVSLPPATYVAIAQRLQTSSALLPSSLRTFNRLNVGYLFA